jgi:hypothetical protein
MSKEFDDFMDGVKNNHSIVEKLIDKDIFNQAILAMEEMYGSGCETEIDAYFRGAKWYRELGKTLRKIGDQFDIAAGIENN